ncbi:hypothetical protein ACUH97_03780 [Dermabacteraceae bacterium P13088]
MTGNLFTYARPLAEIAARLCGQDGPEQFDTFNLLLEELTMRAQVVVTASHDREGLGIYRDGTLNTRLPLFTSEASFRATHPFLRDGTYAKVVTFDDIMRFFARYPQVAGATLDPATHAVPLEKQLLLDAALQRQQRIKPTQDFYGAPPEGKPHPTRLPSGMCDALSVLSSTDDRVRSLALLKKGDGLILVADAEREQLDVFERLASACLPFLTEADTLDIVGPSPASEGAEVFYRRKPRLFR